jgi:hypothetical protein
MVDYIDRLNWNLVKRQSYTAPIIARQYGSYDYEPLADIQLVMRSPILLIGVKSTKAEPHWKRGCWASQYLPFIPSSESEFTAAVKDPVSYPCQLGVLNKIEFPYTGISPYILNISFPYWLEQASIEVWQYSENLVGVYEPPKTELYRLQESLNRIEEKLGNPQGPEVSEDFTVEFTNEET